MADALYPTRGPISSENFTVRMKKEGGIVFVDDETGKETDELELFIKNRPADDEGNRDIKDVKNVRYTGLELELIEVAYPVDVIRVDDSVDGGAVVGLPVATTENKSEWPEVEHYIKQAMMLEAQFGKTIEPYANIMSSEDLKLDLKVGDDRKDSFNLKMIENRSNSEFIYHEYFRKLVSGTFALDSLGNLVVIEKFISNFDYKGDFPDYLDLDLKFRIQLIGDMDLKVGKVS